MGSALFFLGLILAELAINPTDYPSGLYLRPLGPLRTPDHRILLAGSFSHRTPVYAIQKLPGNKVLLVYEDPSMLDTSLSVLTFSYNGWIQDAPLLVDKEFTAHGIRIVPRGEKVVILARTKYEAFKSYELLGSPNPMAIHKTNKIMPLSWCESMVFYPHFGAANINGQVWMSLIDVPYHIVPLMIDLLSKESASDQTLRPPQEPGAERCQARLHWLSLKGNKWIRQASYWLTPLPEPPTPISMCALLNRTLVTIVGQNILLLDISTKKVTKKHISEFRNLRLTHTAIAAVEHSRCVIVVTHDPSSNYIRVYLINIDDGRIISTAELVLKGEGLCPSNIALSTIANRRYLLAFLPAQEKVYKDEGYHLATPYYISSGLHLAEIVVEP